MKRLMKLKSKGAMFVKSQNELLSLLDNISEDKLKMTKELPTKIPEYLRSNTKSYGDDKVDANPLN